MQNLQYEQVRYANGFVPVTTTLSHGQRSKCADLLNSYDQFIIFYHFLRGQWETFAAARSST